MKQVNRALALGGRLALVLVGVAGRGGGGAGGRGSGGGWGGGGELFEGKAKGVEKGGGGVGGGDVAGSGEWGRKRECPSRLHRQERAGDAYMAPIGRAHV